MNKKHEQHLAMIKREVIKDLDIKYREGNKKHGGNLWEKDCLAESMKEAIDQTVYIKTEIKKREKCHCIHKKGCPFYKREK